MAANSDQPLIAALDIGSSKVTALIVTRDADGRLRVLGTGQRESRGVKRGYVTDMEASEVAVREAVEIAERISGVTIDDVWASFAAGGLVSDLANVEVELGGHQVEQSDIDELLSAGKAAIDRNGQVVLHAHPALYTIDGVEGVQHPIGLHADRLGVDIHVVAADPAPLRNIDYVIRSAHLGVKSDRRLAGCGRHRLSDAGRARAGRRASGNGSRGDQCLASRRRHAGRAALDPAGCQGHHRRHRLRLRRAAARGGADEVPVRLGHDVSPRDNHEMVEATPIGGDDGGEPLRITHAQLITVIRQRTEQITNEIERALKELGFSGPVGRQVVLTGGGAELKNIADYMQGVLGRAVRVGRPKTITGLPEAHSGPAFSTLVGLAQLAASGSGDIRDLAMIGVRDKKPAAGMLGRLVAAMRGGF